jgi:hypothetical protein
MKRILGMAAALAVLAACSPALNWRQASLAGAGLAASLPCKPDQVKRNIELAGEPVSLHMLGCDAAGATYAVACARLSDPALAGAALTHWRAAVLAGMHASQAGPPGAPESSPFLPAGALELPQSLRMTAQGRNAQGSPVWAQAAWFARVKSAQIHVCHAVVFSPEPDAAAAEPFFTGLALQ